MTRREAEEYWTYSQALSNDDMDKKDCQLIHKMRPDRVLRAKRRIYDWLDPESNRLIFSDFAVS